LRWTPQEVAATGDGMPIESLELLPYERTGFRLLNAWSLSRGAAWLGATRLLPRRTAAVYRRSAAIGLLSTAGHAPTELVQGGEVLERLWLTAARHGVSFQPITGITFLLLRCRLRHGEGLSPRHQRLLHTLAEQLTQLVPHAQSRTPIMLFRLGYAEVPTARAIRQPLQAVLSHEAT
jgi:nitroreductase